MIKLPEFVITVIADVGCAGTFEPSKCIGEDWIGCLILEMNRVIWGRFVSVDMDARTATFRLDVVDDAVNLEVGSRHPYLDGYWGEQAEIVLNRARDWKQARFQSTDAVEYIRDGQTIHTRATVDAPAGGPVIANAWDHEHCIMCSRTIGSPEDPIAWTDAKGDWLCGECHSYVAARSLEFVNPNDLAI